MRSDSDVVFNIEVMLIQEPERDTARKEHLYFTLTLTMFILINSKAVCLFVVTYNCICVWTGLML